MLDNIKNVLDKISVKEINSRTNTPDNETKTAQEDLEKSYRAEIIKDIKQNREEREKYARWTFRLVIGWIIVIFILIFFKGFSLSGFDLSDTVIVALIGGTTANIISVLVIIMNFLFPARKK